MNSPTDRRHIAIYHTWPEIKNAEYEVILRIVAAARNIGIDVSVMDNDSYTIWSTNPSYNQEMLRIDHKNCDFAISLHFESPKTADIYTYATLWNPYEFYFLWGYDKSIVKLLSHDDLLTSGSKPAEAHALNLFQAIGRPVPTPLPELFPTLATILFEPNISKASRLFYIGINWERINATRGRHHDLLVALDEADMIDIYGPEIFLGVKPWEGFESYRGAIPFDGTTTIRKIAEAGICLAFSSAAHQRSLRSGSSCGGGVGERGGCCCAVAAGVAPGTGRGRALPRTRKPRLSTGSAAQPVTPGKFQLGRFG